MIGCSFERLISWETRLYGAIGVRAACCGFSGCPGRARQGSSRRSKDDKKADDAQKKEIQSVVKIVDDVVAGQPAPNDLSLTWAHEDLLKAQGNKEYVPFTVTLDPSKVPGGKVSFYWRVVSKTGGRRHTAADRQEEGRQEGRQGQAQDASPTTPTRT